MHADIAEVWNFEHKADWKQALTTYQRLIPKRLRHVEARMERLTIAEVGAMDATEWFQFLTDEYFRWKFTSYYKRMRGYLEKHREAKGEDHLVRVKEEHLAADKGDIGHCPRIAEQIGGLKTAGASGLLALLYPEKFGTLDKFFVSALQAIPDVRDRRKLELCNPSQLDTYDGVVLNQIMRQKAALNNTIFGTAFWIHVEST